MSLCYQLYESPLGILRIAADEQGVRKLALTKEDWLKYEEGLEKKISPVANLPYPVVQQLDEYFSKERESFDLPLVLEGSSFYQEVWKSLQSIPYGATRSYSEIAQAVGRPKAPRAIGQANRANPLPILIPCHRVVGKKGKLVGYAGTRTDLKEFLLRLEGALS